MKDSQVGVLRLWTFGPANDLSLIASQLGADKWGSIWSFERGGCERKNQKLGDRPFAAARSRKIRETGLLLRCAVMVSPFDAAFPIVDWDADLERDCWRMRLSISSRVGALYLRNITSYPSYMHIECEPGGASESLSSHFRNLCLKIQEILGGFDHVGLVGGISNGGDVLPPESVSPRIEQVVELKTRLDRFYPVASVPVFEHHGRTFSIASELDMFAHADASFWFQSFMTVMDDVAYGKFVADRGFFTTPDGAVVFGSRDTHPLHAMAQQLFASKEMVFVPLLSGEVAAVLGLLESQKASLLIRKERAAALYAAVGLFSVQQTGASESPKALEKLLGVLSHPDIGLSDVTIDVLRRRWSAHAP